MRRQLLFGAVITCSLLLAPGCGKKTEPGATEPSPPGPSAGAPSESAPTEADKAEAAKRLRQIMVALFNYHDSNQRFPAGVAGPNGQLGLSWRVAILPQLGPDEAELYKQFNLKEPWDSEHNKKLIEKMPKVYSSPGPAAASGKTHFRSFAGPNAFIPAAKGKEASEWAKQMAGQPARGRTMPSFTDGTSNTLAVVEAPEAVEWTKPDDIPFTDAAAPVPKLGGVFPGGFHAVLADGVVHFFPDTLAEKDLRALITINAGDNFGPEVLAMLRNPKPQPKDPTSVPTNPTRVSTKRGPTMK